MKTLLKIVFFPLYVFWIIALRPAKGFRCDHCDRMFTGGPGYMKYVRVSIDGRNRRICLRCANGLR